MDPGCQQLLWLGDVLHRRSARVGPGVTTSRTFHVHRLSTTARSATCAWSWLRPFSSKRWAHADPYGSLDPAIATLWFGADA